MCLKVDRGYLQTPADACRCLQRGLRHVASRQPRDVRQQLACQYPIDAVFLPMEPGPSDHARESGSDTHWAAERANFLN